jgi:multisubunit Na+/H+ antiporter MnhB subunit
LPGEQQEDRERWRNSQVCCGEEKQVWSTVMIDVVVIAVIVEIVIVVVSVATMLERMEKR